MAEIRVGISGWRYKGWRGGKFYPSDLVQKDELQFAAEQFDTIEINGSFYSLQRPSSYRHWRTVTPAGFVFSVKGGRFITHMKRLKDVEVPLANFFASGVLALEQKLGPFLWQFPPAFKFDAERLEHFFQLLPGNTEEAGELASGHDNRLKERAVLRSSKKRKLRHAVEIRHESFVSEEFTALLKKYGIGLVIADTGGKWPLLEDITADFVYVRLHGPAELYSSGYGEKGINFWEPRLRTWHAGNEPQDAHRVGKKAPTRKSGRDVYVYFDNDAKVDAPRDARLLMERLRQK